MIAFLHLPLPHWLQVIIVITLAPYAMWEYIKEDNEDEEGPQEDNDYLMRP